MSLDYARPLRLYQPRRFEFGTGSAAEIGRWAADQGYRRILVLTAGVMATMTTWS